MTKTKPPPTKNGLLSETARHVVIPSGIVTTGWPAVRDKCASFGVTFDPWQDGAGRIILSKRADGKYACSIGGVVLSIPRQVGKTFLIGAIVFALCMLNPGLTVLWTAHRLRTANETFAKMQAFARRKNVKPHVSKVVLGSGEGAIQFHNGSRILFGARERGFGRGFDDVDVEVFDEAQILTENAIDDMIPAMNTAANPLPLYIGTPPKPTDPSDVFTSKRNEALSGESDDTAYIEFSADEGCSPLDRKQWKKANPSYPTRTPDSAMLRMKKNLTPESYLREGLGIWATDPELGVVDMAAWNALKDEASTIESHRMWALAVSDDRKWSSIGVVGRNADDRLHVEWMEHRAGTAWIVDRVVAGWEAKKIPIRIHSVAGSRAAAFIPVLREKGVEVVEVSTPDVSRAVGQVIDGITAGGLVHLGQPSLDKALRNAGVNPTGLWVPLGGVEITPLVAVTVAAGGVPVEPPNPVFAA